MSSMFTVANVLFSILLNPAYTFPDISPSITNSSDEYYIASLTDLHPSNASINSGIIRCSFPKCHIICDIKDGCSYTVIDASNSSSLSIECTVSLSCLYMKLNHGSSNITSIKCTASNACYNNYFNTNPATNVSVQCHADTKACSSGSFVAENATSIDISCTSIKSQACDSISMYFNNSKSISIMASGPSALAGSVIHALNAGALDISCASSSDQYACFYGTFYVPSYHFKLFCYGTGCSYLPDLYVNTNLSTANISSNGCNECDSAANCISQWNINCDVYLSVQDVMEWRQSATVDSLNCSDDECGCVALVDNMKERFIDDASDPLCIFRNNTQSPNTTRSSAETKKQLSSMVVEVGVLCGVFLLCCILVIGVFRWNTQKRKENVAILNYEVIEPYEPPKTVKKASGSGSRRGTKKHRMSF